MAIYALIFSFGVLYILRLMAQGPRSATPQAAGPRPPGYALGAAPQDPGAGS
jgi:hypothetical protein